MDDRQTSFLPEDYIKRKLELRTNIICLALFALVFLFIAVYYIKQRDDREHVLREQSNINQKFEAAARKIDQLDQRQEQKRAILRKARVTAALIEPVPRSNLLAALINRMPASLGMVELDLASEPVAGGRPIQPPKGSAMANQAKKTAGATGAAAPDVPEHRIDLTLIGVAPTDIQVAQYMAELARCNLLSRVDLVYSEEMRREDWTRRRFRVDMTVSADADVRKIEQLRIRRQANRLAAPIEARKNASDADQAPEGD